MLVGALLIAISAFWRGAADDAFSLCWRCVLVLAGRSFPRGGPPKGLSVPGLKGRQRGLAMGIYIPGPGMVRSQFVVDQRVVNAAI
ncbi:MAG: hypothetical protein CM1200mP20_14910 [Pseudomonadota bacterium]|nr:MAG: hypothetical protein CM1200mP20_14910 [Pseudomonadota bacterium]